MQITLATPLSSIPKISARIRPALARLGILTVRDLLFHFPSRYDDFSNMRQIRSVGLNETVTVQGVIERVSARRTAKKHMALTEAVIRDGSGAIRAIWFNQPFLARTLKEGQRVSISGKTARGAQGIYFQNPAYERAKRNLHTAGLVAVYPESKGISSRWLRFLTKSFMPLASSFPDPLPLETLRRYQLPGARDAIRMIHFPKTLEEAERAKKRFQFEKLLLIRLRALREKHLLKKEAAPRIPLDLPLVKSFVASLPFALTDAQRRSLWEILQDLSKSQPMNRLLEGDVGSGKTVVAAAAALLVSRAGFQTAFLAPTEILAHQHFATLAQVLAPFSISMGLLTGTHKRSMPSDDVVVGTHALLQKDVRFDRLGFVVVDEQHRFGVRQRAALLQKQEEILRQAQDISPEQSRGIPKSQGSMLLPHFLSMSATPIPRTLALTLYGDLDLSLLDEMPQSRKKIITSIIPPSKREDAYHFIRKEVAAGRQVFVICPRIDAESGIRNQESGKGQQQLLLSDVKAVKEEYKKLSEEIFPDLRVGMLHGKMKAKEKADAMERFRKGEADILVSTSVVEVGVDVPNATLMMIEGAERFGLATLHQFRGRVGRGSEQSYCLLFPTEDGVGAQRLRALMEANTGFELAEKDLELRGAGDLLGVRQWGVESDLIDALRDQALVRIVNREATLLMARDPSLASCPLLKQALESAEKQIHLE